MWGRVQTVEIIIHQCFIVCTQNVESHKHEKHCVALQLTNEGFYERQTAYN